MNRRAAIAAVVTASVIFFFIRLGVRLLAQEAAIPEGTVVTYRSPTNPVAMNLPRTPEEARSDANTRLLALATEAREHKEMKTASLAYEAKRALERNDCARATQALAEAGAALSPDSTVKGGVEAAQRPLDEYCRTMIRD